ncbi:hypothetical protein ILYODFUR_037992 [Ilyodon furcidens]|uniref:Uncharacterized protein n=1 Tax=Ilyodon furcidens TaxID=33524 RepID=A0ABV0SW63_9TELE
MLFAPIPHGSLSRWWAHWGMALRLSFGLGLARSREEQPGILRRVPTPGLAPGWDPGSAVPGDVTCLVIMFLMKAFLTALCLTRHPEPVCHGRSYQGHLSPRQHSL